MLKELPYLSLNMFINAMRIYKKKTGEDSTKVTALKSNEKNTFRELIQYIKRVLFPRTDTEIVQTSTRVRVSDIIESHEGEVVTFAIFVQVKSFRRV